MANRRSMTLARNRARHGKDSLPNSNLPLKGNRTTVDFSQQHSISSSLASNGSNVMYVTAGTLDDLLHKVLVKLLKSRDRIRPRKGDAVEIRGALLKLTNPRARLSSTETKGTIFSCLGELLWYLSGRNDLESIQYYLKDYGDFAEPDGTIHGAYGPRLYGFVASIKSTTCRKFSPGTTHDKPSSSYSAQRISIKNIKMSHAPAPCSSSDAGES